MLSGPIYSSAASSAGLHRALADAPAAEVSIQVSLYSESGVTADMGRFRSRASCSASSRPSAAASCATGGCLAPRAATLVHGQASNKAIIAFRDGLSDHATLVDGGWPAEGGALLDPIPVVVVDGVAKELSLGVGDMLSPSSPRPEPAGNDTGGRHLRRRHCRGPVLKLIAEPPTTGISGRLGPSSPPRTIFCCTPASHGRGGPSRISSSWPWTTPRSSEHEWRRSPGA